MAKDEMTPIRCDIVLAFADSRMSVGETAKRLYVDRKTVWYHLKVIRSITGKNPMNFFDLYDLVTMVKGAKNNE